MLGRSDSSGWVGFGIANQDDPKMVGSESVIGWFNVTESVHSYLLTGKKSDMIILNDNNIPLVDTRVCIISINSTTWTGVHFVRKIKDGENRIRLDGNTTAVVVAIGAYGSISYHPNRKREIVHINFEGGEVKNGSEGLVLAHALIMFISWGVVLQFGALFARYAKKSTSDLWFKVHRFAQMAGYVLSIGGLIISFIMVKGSHFNTKIHGQFGLTIMAMGLVQIIIAVIRPHRDINHPKTIFRSIWEYIHWWFGRITLIFALLNLFLGLSEYNAKNLIVAIYLIYTVIILLVYAILELRRKLILDREEAKKTYTLVPT